MPSVGSVDDAFDRGLAESFVDTLKSQLIRDHVGQTIFGNLNCPSSSTSAGSTTQAA